MDLQFLNWTQKKAKPFSVSNQTGFTLLEILIVLSILVLVTAILLVSLSQYAKRQEFNTTVIDVRDGVTHMRQQTLGSINDSLYGVHVSSTAVVFFEGVDFVEGDPENSTINLPTSIMATTTLANDMTTATFTRLTGLPSATGTIVLFNEDWSNSATITISATGLVE